MSFAYNGPKAHRVIVDLSDAHDVEGLFDSIASAVGTVTNAASKVNSAVATGTRVANAVGASAQRLQRGVAQTRQAFSPSRAPVRAAPMRAPSPARVAAVAPAATRAALTQMRVAEGDDDAPAESSSNAVPIAIGVAAVAAIGGGAWWFLGRKGGGRASHR